MDPVEEREFREFVAARGQALYRTAYLLTGHHQQAEDLVQTALSRVPPRWRRIRSQPEAYVRRILYHEQVNRWRLRSWGRETSVREPLERSDERDRTADVDLRLSVGAALRRLTPRQRAVLVLRFYEDLPEADAAAMLDVSVGTIRSTCSRALARLRADCPDLNPASEATR
ncbi:MAG: hypothetical protein V7637_3997 [Mycobacteriales bacterium]|jgi:RNA polymerase sigma-70 factor (sigma-E family)